MTISMKEIRKFEENQDHDNTPYNAKKSRASYELQGMSRKARGELLERIVAHKIEEETGFECNALRGNQPWDITVNLNKPVRIEVKSSLINKTMWQRHGYEQYALQSIKPENFDYLFIVLITPTGPVVKWADVRDIEFSGERHGLGYCLAMNERTIPDYFFDLEDFPYNPVSKGKFAN